jgi:hypothetical protein
VRRRQGWTLSVLIVLAVGTALRLWGIRYGLPWLFYFHDEPQVVLRALRFGTGDLNPHFFIWPGILLLYLAFLAFALLFGAGRVAGWWAGRAGFAAAYFRDPSPFYLLPRLQSVALGVWTLWLTAKLGRIAYSRTVGLAAALGLAVNALHGHYAHFAHPVTGATAFMTLGLVAAVRLAQGGRTRHLALGALALALGVSCQYHAAVLAAPLGVAVAFRAREDAPGRRARWWGRGLLAGIAAVAGFLILSPFTLLDFPAFSQDLLWILRKTAGTATGGSPGIWAGFEHFIRGALVPALGLPLAVVFGGGLVLALIRRTRADVVLLVYAVVFLALGSRAGIVTDRYAIPLVPVALLFAARLVEEGLALRVRGPRARAAAVPALVLLLCAPVAVRLVETDYAMTRSDTRLDATAWFESHVPAGERVVIDMLRFWNTASPPLAENRERLLERIEEAGSGLTGAGHSSVYADYYRYLLANPRAPAYYLASTNMGNDARPLTEYRAAGFRWAVVSERVVGGRWEREADPQAPEFYRSLREEGELMASFSPKPWLCLGPTIWIYRF